MRLVRVYQFICAFCRLEVLHAELIDLQVELVCFGHICVQFKNHLLQLRLLLINDVTQRAHTVLRHIFCQLQGCTGLVPAIRFERLHLLGEQADLDCVQLISVSDREKFIGVLLLGLHPGFEDEN